MFQLLDGLLNVYHDKCLDIMLCFDDFSIHRLPRHENSRANMLHIKSYACSNELTIELGGREVSLCIS